MINTTQVFLLEINFHFVIMKMIRNVMYQSFYSHHIDRKKYIFSFYIYPFKLSYNFDLDFQPKCPEATSGFFLFLKDYNFLCISFNNDKKTVS